MLPQRRRGLADQQKTARAATAFWRDATTLSVPFFRDPLRRRLVDPRCLTFILNRPIGLAGATLWGVGVKGLSGFVHVVDDDASFRKAMERRLKQAGYEVATYPSAMHLLVNLPAENIPSCILLDVQIPGLDGPGLQKRLNELGSTLPIVFIAGNPDIPTTVRAIKAGADDFLTKPVTSDDLFRAIEQALAHHRTLRDLKDKLDSVRARAGRLTPREREVFELVVAANPTSRSLGR